MHPDMQVNLSVVLATAMDIAKGMAQLHAFNIIHSDCKTQNILLKSVSGEHDQRGFMAKVRNLGTCAFQAWHIRSFPPRGNKFEFVKLHSYLLCI
jgi:serine/threonine protein kinase